MNITKPYETRIPNRNGMQCIGILDHLRPTFALPTWHHSFAHRRHPCLCIDHLHAPFEHSGFIRWEPLDGHPIPSQAGEAKLGDMASIGFIEIHGVFFCAEFIYVCTFIWKMPITPWSLPSLMGHDGTSAVARILSISGNQWHFFVFLSSRHLW